MQRLLPHMGMPLGAEPSPLGYCSRRLALTGDAADSTVA
jgi:hypothetical protein